MKHEGDNAAEACGAGEEVLLKHAERRGVVEVCGGVGVLPRRAEEEGGAAETCRDDCRSRGIAFGEKRFCRGAKAIVGLCRSSPASMLSC